MIDSFGHVHKISLAMPCSLNLIPYPGSEYIERAGGMIGLCRCGNMGPLLKGGHTCVVLRPFGRRLCARCGKGRSGSSPWANSRTTGCRTLVGSMPADGGRNLATSRPPKPGDIIVDGGN